MAPSVEVLWNDICDNRAEMKYGLDLTLLRQRHLLLTPLLTTLREILSGWGFCVITNVPKDYSPLKSLPYSSSFTMANTWFFLSWNQNPKPNEITGKSMFMFQSHHTTNVTIESLNVSSNDNF